MKTSSKRQDLYIYISRTFVFLSLDDYKKHYLFIYLFIYLLIDFKYDNTVIFITANCFSALGLDSGEIKDEALSQSIPINSEPDNAKPHFIRLNEVVRDFPYGWRPRTTFQDYVQVITIFL